MAAQVREVDIAFPDKLRFLFEPHRYKVAYGGRGGAKSWGFARALLIMAAQKPLLVVCAREIQNSIADSVHRLLSNQIKLMGLEGFFTITNEKIRGANGSEFIFKGLWQNVDNIKSLEGADVVWLEEANLTSKNTWDKLTPTVRKEGSEIWCSYNPEFEDDPTHDKFVMNVPPTNSVVVKINYSDNPWFPAILRQEMMDDRSRLVPSEFAHKWEGECKRVVDGAIFAEQITAAAEDNRITSVPVTEGVPVNTFWDLGQSDNTAIWFVQLIGMEYRVIDYYENSGLKMPHYIGVLAQRGYFYGEHCLPHDAEHDQIAAQTNIKQQLQQALRDNPDLGKSVKIVPRVAKKAQAIDAVRRIFDRCVFDKVKTAAGVKCLSRYRYKKNEDTGLVSREPVHDAFSHGADAFMQLAQHAQSPRKPKQQQLRNLKRFK